MNWSIEPFTHHIHSTALTVEQFYHVTLYKKNGTVGYACCTLSQLRNQFVYGRLQFRPDAPNEQGAWPCQWFE